MTAPDASITFSLAPGEKPLGIQQPFLPATPLGQSLVQAKFLTPLGVRSLTVLEPAVFRSTEPSTTFDWQSPFQESPFFDAPEPPSTTNLPTQLPALQTRSLDSTNSVDWSIASSRANVEAPPVLNLKRSEPSIAPPIASPATPALTSPSVDRSSAFIDPIVSATAFADEAAEPLVKMSALDGADVIETRASSDAATNQATADEEAKQPIDRTPPASDPVASPTPTTAPVLQRRSEGNQPSAELKTLPPAIAPTQADDRIALAPVAVEPFADAISERPLPESVAETVSLDDEAAVSLPPPAVSEPAVNEPTENAVPTALTVPTSTTPTVAAALPSATEASAPAIARLVSENPVTEVSAPAITRLVSEKPVTEAGAQSNIEPSVPAIQLRPDALPVETTAPPETTRSQSHLEAVTPDVSVPETSTPAIAPVTPEPFTAASNPQTVTDSPPLDSTPSSATEPDATPSALPAIALTPLADATALEDTTATEPTRSDPVVQLSPVAPTVIPAIAPVPKPEALLSETPLPGEMPTRSDSVVQPSPAAPTVIPAIAPVAEPEAPLPERPLPGEAFPNSLAMPPNRPEPDSAPPSDVRLNAAPVDTNLVSAPELPTTNTLQAKREPDETVERMVGHPVDRVNDVSETVQMKLAADAIREDGSDVVQRKPNHAPEEQTAEFRAPESIEQTLGNEPLDATAVAPTASMQSDRSVEPAMEPSITTQTETQTNQPPSAATASLFERTQLNEPSIAANVDLSRSRLEPLTTSALDSEVLALDSPSQADTPTPLVQLDGIEAATPSLIQSKAETEPLIQPKAETEPLIQPKAETSAAPAIAPQPTISDVTSTAVQNDVSEPSPLLTTEPDLNFPTLLDSEVLALDSPPQADTPTPSVPFDGIEAATPPLIQSKAETSAAPAIVPQPIISDVTSAAVQNDDSEPSPLPTTEPGLNLPTLNLPTAPTQTSGMAMEAVQRQPVELNEPAAPLDAVADIPETVSPKAASPEVASPEAALPEAVASNQFSALPELPTTIQRLSVWEPLVQMQPLVASVAPPAMQPVQTAHDPDVATSSPSQTVDRAADSLSTPGLDRFNPVLPSNVSSFNDVVSLKTEAAPAEWSSIAELFQSTEASQFTEPQSNTLQPDATLTNGYTDLNLRPDNTALPDVIQRELEAPPAIAVPATPTPDAEPITGQPSLPSQPQSPQASPEQLERLAQEIYKLVRQRLAVERERGGNFYPRRSM